MRGGGRKKKLYIRDKLPQERAAATNLLEEGNTRANKFPKGNPGAKSDSATRWRWREEGATTAAAAFFWKIAGDPGIFVRLYRCIRSGERVPSRVTTRKRKVIFARARGQHGRKLFRETSGERREERRAGQGKRGRERERSPLSHLTSLRHDLTSFLALS